MGSLLASHLDQINTCSRSIGELPFPGPRGFTNAILANHDITTLIRDTEAHERALFHLATPVAQGEIGGNSQGVAPISSAALKSRRTTMQPPRQAKSKAVAAILGGELYAQIQAQNGMRQAGEVDIDLLLQGAQKLASVYPIPGALDKIAQLKRRHAHLQANITHYEGKVAQQSAELEVMRTTAIAPELEQDDMANSQQIDGPHTQLPSLSQRETDADIETIQQEITELERKKQGLADRVAGMERDLGGLLR